MLTSEHGIEDANGYPDELTPARHVRYPAYAEQMLAVYREGIGTSRKELHRAVARIFDEEPDCPPRRIAAFCKLLDDLSVFDTDRSGAAAQLRKKVFRLAACRHPLVSVRERLIESEEHVVKESIARELGTNWPELKERLFLDVHEFNTLVKFSGCATPRELLSRYNVGQWQVMLYRATRLTVRAREDLKVIVTHAKLARLMHTIERDGDAYVIQFDGPASVLRETRKYGVNMAVFFPVLLMCRNWEMEAVIRRNRRGWKKTLRLSDKKKLQGYLPEPEEFDSSVEAALWKKWGDAPRNGWTLSRESEILHCGQTVFFPDFTMRHKDGRVVHLEIVGFWTKKYLVDKLALLEQFKGQRILLAVSERISEQLPPDHHTFITYKSAVKLEPLLSALAAI